MKKLIVVVFFIASYVATRAQSNELIGQYYLNMPAYNPSHTGTDDFLRITAGSRQQWAGLNGSPYNSFVSAYGSIRPSGYQNDSIPRAMAKHGIGGYVMNNGQGAFKQTEAALMYAYHIPVAKGTYLSLGMSPTFYSERIVVPQVVVENPNDPAYQSLLNQGDRHTRLHINAGLGLHSDKFYLSYSIRELASASLSGNKEFFNNAGEKRHHFLAGYVIPVNAQLKIVPNTFVRLDKSRPLLFELGGRALYKENLWAGAAFRNDKTVVGSFGILFKNKFHVGYAYEYKGFGISQYARGTHEFVVGVQLFKNKSKAKVISTVATVPPPVKVEPVVAPQPVEPVKPKVKVLNTTVKTEDGETLAGATLEIKNLTTTEVQHLTVNGNVHKINITEGNDYQITAEKDGYIPQTIQILSDEVATIETEKTSLLTLKKIALFKKLSVGETIEMDIRYDVNKTVAKEESRQELDKLVDLMKNNTTLKIEIGSHTDARGSNEANHVLSQKRSEEVVKYLISKGISKNRLSPVGYGETKPKVANAKTEADHAQNRRTTIQILATE